MRSRALALLAAATGLLALAACGGGSDGGDPPASQQPSTGAATAAGGPSPAGGRDPRRGGFEVALGEWAVTKEAEAIRPGRVTFVVVNRGTMPHGFELEREGVDDSDDRERIETRILRPGERVRVRLDLREGVYKLECNVEGHDDLGMETLLRVEKDAPLARTSGGGQAAAQANAVAVESFAYSPQRIEVSAGQEVTWTNHDPARHTVTAEDGSFDSGTMESEGTFGAVFDDPGEYRYICSLHPGMEGVVVVRSAS